jgi:Pyrimidine dimer DNA glycosylase
MWRGHAGALLDYGIAVCLEWVSRGYNDTMYDRFVTMSEEVDLGESFHYPTWWGGPIHMSHQAALVRKDPTFYRPIFPDVDDTIPYFWPV